MAFGAQTISRYQRECAQHVHTIPRYRLEGVRKIQICLPPSPELGAQLRQFARVWHAAVAQLRRRGLEKLAYGVSIAMTSRRGYYARFWRDNILCVNLRDFLGQKDAIGILIHELGHRVWFRVARQRTRARWAADHHQRLKIDRNAGSFVSQYAKTNALEDHAEAFRERVQGGLTGHAKTRYERLGPVTRTIRGRLASHARR